MSCLDKEYCCPEEYDTSVFSKREWNGREYLWYAGDADEIWLPEGCVSISRMFIGDAKVPRIVHGIEFVEDATQAFAFNSSEYVDLSGWDLSKVESFNFAFLFSKVKSVSLPEVWTNLEYAQGIFKGCSSLEEVSLNFGSTRLQFLDELCKGCCGLKRLKLSFTSATLPWMDSLVAECNRLQCIDFSGVRYEKKPKEWRFSFLQVCSPEVELSVSKEFSKVVKDSELKYSVYAEGLPVESVSAF